MDFVETAAFASFNLVVRIVAILIRVFAHAHMINTFFKIQGYFRLMGHIRGFKGEILLATMYLLFLTYLFNWFVFRPIYQFRIQTSSFECNHLDKVWLARLTNFERFVWPITFQVLFIAQMW